jgi:hypothetical protein
MLTRVTSSGSPGLARGHTRHSGPRRILIIGDVPCTARAIDAPLEAASSPGASVMFVVRPSVRFGCARDRLSFAGVDPPVDECLSEELLALSRTFPPELPIELAISRIYVRRRRLMDRCACDRFVGLARWWRRAPKPGGYYR